MESRRTEMFTKAGRRAAAQCINAVYPVVRGRGVGRSGSLATKRSELL